MGFVRFLGPPTFFITVTANPNWPEILRELRPGEKASDSPDIIGRIFNNKCNAIIAELKAGLFGAFRVLFGLSSIRSADCLIATS
jgi:hypothetical protein